MIQSNLYQIKNKKDQTNPHNNKCHVCGLCVISFRVILILICKNDDSCVV